MRRETVGYVSQFLRVIPRVPTLDAILASCTHVDEHDAAQTAPLLELFGALHDRLDGRLFQS
mgnify:CR=1 FL=1